MTKQEKKAILDAACVAYYSGWNGIEIKTIEYGINDYIVYVSGCFCGKREVHKSRVYYGMKENTAYFKYNGKRIPLNECIRVNAF